MPRILLTCSALLSCMSFALPAGAQDWTVDQKRSSMEIVGKKPTGTLSGSIQKWDGKINFDPEHLESSHVIINVDVGSINMGDRQWNSVLPTPDWLSAKAFPLATFESTSFTHKGGNAYEAAGTLTIRGIQQNVALPFTMDLSGQTAHAQGTLSLVRTDFGIGGVLGNNPEFGLLVGVTFNLTATK